jgi:hypothetical protein
VGGSFACPNATHAKETRVDKVGAIAAFWPSGAAPTKPRNPGYVNGADPKRRNEAMTSYFACRAPGGALLLLLALAPVAFPQEPTRRPDDASTPVRREQVGPEPDYDTSIATERLRVQERSDLLRRARIRRLRELAAAQGQRERLAALDRLERQQSDIHARRITRMREELGKDRFERARLEMERRRRAAAAEPNPRRIQSAREDAAKEPPPPPNPRRAVVRPALPERPAPPPPQRAPRSRRVVIR